MTEPAGDNLPGVSWFESFLRHIRYGITLIRRDGLAYFFKRLYQFAARQVLRAWQSLRITLSRYRYGELIDIEDIPGGAQLEQDQAAWLTAGGDSPSARGDLIRLGITCRKQSTLERQDLIEQGQRLYSNRRVLFVSPIRVLGGGANMIFLTVAAMQRMGIDAQILNLNVHRQWFEKNYPDQKLPVIFAGVEDIPTHALGFDAVIATSNPTVGYIAPAKASHPSLVVGYYIQDYEPYFYPQGTHEFERAFASYSLIPGLVRMVTTPWIADQIRLHHHLDSAVVGAHMDIDLFQPRPRSDSSWPDRPLRITAMIRPTTARRNPALTMTVLQQASKKVPLSLQIRLFGCDPTDPGFASLPQDFPWQLAGQLRSAQVANLFNEADIFVDLSDFQAFGLTALEAMASGLAVIVPANGGTNVYAKHETNSLVVDTHDPAACLDTLERLIRDEALRMNLQANAVSTATQFYAELPALKMLKALFPGDK